MSSPVILARAETLVACADAAFQWPEALQMYYQTAVFGREGSGARSTSRLNRPALEWKHHNCRLIDGRLLTLRFDHRLYYY